MTSAYSELHAQEFLFLRTGSVPCPRAAGPSQGVRLRLPGPHRHQSVRGVGVCTAGRQPGHPSHHRRGVDSHGRDPAGAVGYDPPRLRQPLTAVHPRQCRVDRREPRLDPKHLPHHAEGLVLLTGGRDGPVSKLLLEGRRRESGRLLEGVHGVVRAGLGLRGGAAQLPAG